MDNFANTQEDTKEKQCVEKQQTKEESLLWVRITLNGVAMYPEEEEKEEKKEKEGKKNESLIVGSYAQFEPNAIVDGRNRVIKFSLQNDNSVAATLPHFWESSGMNKKIGRKKKTNKKK